MSLMIPCELGKKLSKSTLILTSGNAEDSLELELGTVAGTGLDSFQWRPILVGHFACTDACLSKASEIDLFVAEESFLAYILIEASDLCPLIRTMCLPGTLLSFNINWIEVTRTQ